MNMDDIARQKDPIVAIMACGPIINAKVRQPLRVSNDNVGGPALGHNRLDFGQTGLLLGSIVARWDVGRNEPSVLRQRKKQNVSLVAQEGMEFVERKVAVHTYIGDGVLMGILLAWKVNTVEVANPAMSSVAAQQPRGFHHFLTAVHVPDCCRDDPGPLRDRDQLGLPFYFKVVTAQQSLEDRFRLALLQSLGERVGAVELAPLECMKRTPLAYWLVPNTLLPLPRISSTIPRS
jgi:hypothetical protein